MAKAVAASGSCWVWCRWASGAARGLAVLMLALLCLMRPVLAQGKADIQLAWVSLTADERSWLAAHQPIRLGLYKGGWEPFDIIDRTGRHDGISADYLSLVSQRLGIQIEPVMLPDWQSVIAAVKAHDIDLIASIAHTPERENFLAFSKPYITSNNLLFARRDGRQWDLSWGVPMELPVAEVTARSQHQHARERRPRQPCTGCHHAHRGGFHGPQAMLAQAFGAARLVVARRGREDLIALYAVVLHGGC